MQQLQPVCSAEWLQECRWGYKSKWLVRPLAQGLDFLNLAQVGSDYM
jgi:hypothetical protein